MGLKESVLDFITTSTEPVTVEYIAICLVEEWARRGYDTSCFNDWIEELVMELCAEGELMWDKGYRVPSLLEKIALAASRGD